MEFGSIPAAAPPAQFSVRLSRARTATLMGFSFGVPPCPSASPEAAHALQRGHLVRAELADLAIIGTTVLDLYSVLFKSYVTALAADGSGLCWLPGHRSHTSLTRFGMGTRNQVPGVLHDIRLCHSPTNGALVVQCRTVLRCDFGRQRCGYRPRFHYPR